MFCLHLQLQGLRKEISKGTCFEPDGKDRRNVSQILIANELEISFCKDLSVSFRIIHITPDDPKVKQKSRLFLEISLQPIPR